MSLQFTKPTILQQRLRTAIYLAVGLSLPLAVQADPVFPLPASVDASRVAQMLNPESMPKATVGPATPKFTPQPISPDAARITFKLDRLAVSGSSVYGDQQIANLFQNYLGHVISLADLQQIADTITLKYRRDGYILSKAVIPAQQIKSGVVNIRVVEGYVNSVDIQGDPKGARELLAAYGDHIKAARPLNIKTLERYALLANDIPGMDIKTIISAAQPPTNVMAPSDITSGAADLTFIASQHTASGYLSYDNHGTKYLGPEQITLGSSVNSIFRSGDQTSIQGLVTEHTHELQYINVSHKTPLGTNGATFNLAANYTRTNPGFHLEPFDVQGRSEYVSAGISYPIIRERNQSLFLNTSLDALNNKTDLAAFNAKLYEDHIRSLRIGATYDKADRWLGINELGGQLSQGLKIFDASKDNSILNSRPDGRSDYTKANLNLSRLQGLPKNFSLLAAVTAQYALTPLLSAEQFSYGGSQFGQAYDPSEITGDRGIAAKVEIRYDTYPGLRVLNNVQYYTFYDIGKVWNIDHNNGQTANQSGSSTGLGVRAYFTKYFSSTLELAKPLTRTVATMSDKDARVFFSVALAGDTPSNNNPNPAPPSMPLMAKAIAPYTGLTPVKPTAIPTESANSGPIEAATQKNQSNKEPSTSSIPKSPLPQAKYEGLTPTDVSFTN